MDGLLEYNNYSKIDKFVFYFCLIDILFLPYFWIISFSYSLPVLFVWFLFNYKRLELNNEYKLFAIMVFLMLFSTLLSIVIYPKYVSGNEIWFENVKRLVQFATSFLYYFYFSFFFKRYEVSIKRELVSFILFGLFLAIIYNIDKLLFSEIKTYWNNKDSFTIMLNQGTPLQYRYNFIWTDPNNPAYAFVAVLTFLFYNESLNLFLKFTMLLSVLYLLISAMSTGAFLSFFAVSIVFFLSILKDIFLKRKLNKKIKYSSLLFFILLIIVIPVALKLIANYMESELAIEALKRLKGNSGESRIQIWSNTLKNENILKYMVIGRGSSSIIGRELLSTHSGHLYLIYGYGAIAYGIFVYILFRKRKNMSLKSYLFVVPILIGFSINIIITEQKFMLLQCILISAASSKKYLNNSKGY